MTSLGEELDRAETLGLAGVVLHPGACTGGEDDGGLQLIAQSLRSVLKARPRARVRVLLEHTAGQGTVLGHTFEQLARIIELTDGSPRVGVWLDTCHLLAAGYDIATETGYRDVFTWFARVIGLERLTGFHLNDSKTPLGSRVDRHEHIGKGQLGHRAFRRVLNDPRFAKLPMLIETAKTERGSRAQRGARCAGTRGTWGRCAPSDGPEGCNGLRPWTALSGRPPRLRRTRAASKR